MESTKGRYTYDTKASGYIMGLIFIIIFSITGFFGLILTFGLPGVGIPILLISGGGIVVGAVYRKSARVYEGKKFITAETKGNQGAAQTNTALPSESSEGLKTGEIKIKDIPVDLRGLLLAAGEKVVVEIPNVNLIEFLRVEGLWSARNGLTFRSREGVITKGSLEEGWEEQVLDNGRLLITTQRLFYDGKRSAIEIYWPEIISIEPGSNGIGVKSRKKEIVQYFVMVEPLRYALNMEKNGRTFSEPLSGELLAAAVEGVLRQNKSDFGA